MTDEDAAGSESHGDIESVAPGGDDSSGPDAGHPSDTLVEAALRLLPVPEHAPGFWEDLHAALAAEPRRQPAEPSLAVGPGRSSRPVGPGPAPRSAGQRRVAAPAEAPSAARHRPPGDDGSRRLVPPSLRRRSNAVLLALAVAAFVLVVVCGAALVRSRANSGLGPAPATPTAGGVAAAPAR